MKAITFFSEKFTGTRKIAQMAAAKLEGRLIQDAELIETTSKQYRIPIDLINKSIFVAPPFSESFSRKKAQVIAALKNTIAETMKTGPHVYCGFLSQLIPHDLAMRVMVTAGKPQRIEKIFRDEGLTGNDAERWIQRSDRSFFVWTRYLQEEDNWETSEFDIALSSDSVSSEHSIDRIWKEFEAKADEKPVASSNIFDFKLAALVEYAMAEKGIHVAVAVKDKCVDLTIRKPVLMLSRFEKKLKRIGMAVPAVQQVAVHVGSRFFQADIWRKHNFRIPSSRVYEQIEKTYALIHEEVSENGAFSGERLVEIQPRLWM